MKILMFLLFFFISASAGAWQDFEAVSQILNGARIPDAAMNRYDQMAVIWPEGKNDNWVTDVKVRFCMNETWSDEIWLNEGQTDDVVNDCNVAAGPDGSFHFAWTQGRRIVYRKYDIETQWSEENTAGYCDGCLCMTCTARNMVLISYLVASGNIFAFYKFNNEGNWSEEIYVDDRMSLDDPELASGPYGDAHLFFNRGDLDCKLVYAHIQPDGSFEKTCYIDHDKAAFFPCLFADRINRLHMAYLDEPKYLEHPTAFYTKISYPGGPFEQVTQISEGLADLYFEHYPAVVVDEFLQPLVAWTVYWDDTYDNKSNYSRFLSSTYQENYGPIDSDLSMTPRLVMSKSGDVHLIYLRYFVPKQYQVVHAFKPRTHPGSRVVLDLQIFYPEDLFDLSVELTNPTDQTLDVDVYICLEAYGVYYFYPGWSEELTSSHHELAPGAVETIDLLHFAMPNALPDAGPFHVFAGMLDRQTNTLAGDYSGAGFVLRQSR